MWRLDRRRFLQASACGLACGLAAGFLGDRLVAQAPGDRPPQAEGVRVLNPRGRVPVSFIIEDSTCLANLAYFAMPQFAEAWPDRVDYQKPWQGHAAMAFRDARISLALGLHHGGA